VSYSDEFKTVDLITDSPAETRGVDAFALSLIKAERQIRRLFTFLVYQFSCFHQAHVSQLRDTLGSEKVYFEGFECGFNTLFSRTAEDLVGPQYARLRPRMKDAIDFRNKIFHGQLTSKYLSGDDLFALVADIRTWCEALAIAGNSTIGYDGFARNSFRKSPITDLSKNYKVEFMSVADYAHFIRQHMLRHRATAA